MRREISEGSVRAFRLSSSDAFTHIVLSRVRACVRSTYVSTIKGTRAKKIHRWNRARHPAGPRADRRRDKTRLTRKLTVIPLHLFSLYASREITQREHAVFCIMQLGKRGEGKGEEPPPRLLVAVTRDHALINAPAWRPRSEDPLKPGVLNYFPWRAARGKEDPLLFVLWNGETNGIPFRSRL